MGKAKLSKLRWKRLPHDLRVTCYASGCTELTRNYCKRSECREPYCDAHKGQHIFNAHTVKKLLKTAGGDVPLEGFSALPRDRKVELLSLISKINRRKDVLKSGFEQTGDETFTAWATVLDTRFSKEPTRIAKDSNRLEQALQDLYVALREAEAERKAKNPMPVRALTKRR